MRMWKSTASVAASVAMAAGGLLIGLAIGSGQAADGGVPQQTANTALTSDARLADMVPQAAFVNVADTLGPAVVFIQATRPRETQGQPQNQRFQDFFDDFFGRTPRDQQPREDGDESDDDFDFENQARSQGSGVLVSPDGYILTNAHVIAELNPSMRTMDLATSIQVTLQDDRLYEAEIIGADLGTDIALIKVDGRRLPFAPLGDSERLRVGEWVMAIGAPFGLQNTVSAGIVSAIGRAYLSGMVTPYQSFVQTDAAINPGNSGGPLVNLAGEVIGINTAIATSSGLNPSFNGVGFAVPVNMARRVMDQLREHGRVIRGYLGVSVQPLSRDQREAYDLGRRDGAIVVTLNEDGPAETAGVMEGDVVIGLDGEPLDGQQDFLQRIADHGPGDSVELEIIRLDDNSRHTISVTLDERPEEAQVLSDQLMGNNAGPRRRPEQPEEPDNIESNSALALGLRVTELTARLRRQAEIPSGIDGVLVSDVAPNSPAAAQGIAPGDVVRRVRSVITSVEEFDAQMGEFGPGDAVPLQIYRRQTGANFFTALRIPADR